MSLLSLFALGCSDYSISHKVTIESYDDTSAPITSTERHFLLKKLLKKFSEDPEEEIPRFPEEETPEYDYCTEFGDLMNGHSLVMEVGCDNGILYENRGGFYVSVAYTSDFGQAGDFFFYHWLAGRSKYLAGFVFTWILFNRPIGLFELMIHKDLMSIFSDRTY